MVGVITNWDVLAHPLATIRSFGWLVFIRAAFAGPRESFPSLLHGVHSTSGNVSPLLERCIRLELRAKRIYLALAKALDDPALAGPFFATLAEQEQHHADLLEVCQAAAVRGGWRANLFNPWQDYLPRLEQQMDAAEAAVPNIDTVEAALQLVVQIETSEINQVFDAAIAASDAAFVKKLNRFRVVMKIHMSYIVDRLPELAPQLMTASRELRAKFPRAR